jgi:hypothetical protein
MPLVPLAQYKVPRRSAAAQTAQLFNIPSPVGGLNYRDPISDMAPTDALVLENFIPKQTGVVLRKGWRYHTETISAPIRSVFSFNAPDQDDNKIFAAASGHIYDVTTDPPVLVQANTGSTNDVWSVTQFANGADMFLLAVSAGAGYWTYDTTNGWVQQTVTGLPASLISVAVFKNRVWFVAEDDSAVYYLDTVDAITGTASQFEMGSLLRNGGSIRGLINWTLDAGTGIDDYMVVVGSQGDVGVWQGTDPSDAEKFSLRGVWYVGPVPKYGRFFTAYGGDVMIVSELGLVPVSRLVNGQFSEIQPGPAQKIQSVLSPLISKLRGVSAWDIFIVPSSDVLIIKLPEDTGVYTQFAMNVNTAAWCAFSSMPMACCTLLNGQLYFGTEDGRVAKGLFGDLDGTEIDGTGGNPVEGDVQTAFNAFGTPAQLKKFGMARPIFIASAPPSVKLQINTQYTFVSVGGSPSFTTANTGVWNNSLWNIANWAGSSNSYQAWVGTTGLGYYASLRMKVRGFPGTIFTSSHMMTEVGGVM